MASRVLLERCITSRLLLAMRAPGTSLSLSWLAFICQAYVGALYFILHPSWGRGSEDLGSSQWQTCSESRWRGGDGAGSFLSSFLITDTSNPTYSSIPENSIQCRNEVTVRSSRSYNFALGGSKSSITFRKGSLKMRWGDSSCHWNSYGIGVGFCVSRLT